MRNLIKYIKPYIPQIFLILIFVFIQTMSDLSLPDFMSKIIDKGIVGNDMSVIWSVGGQMLLVSLASVCAAIMTGLLASRVAAGFSRNIRKATFVKVESFSLAEFDKFSTASLITRTTNDVQQIQIMLVMVLRMALAAPIMAIGGIMKAVSKDASMSWIFIVAISILITVIIIMISVVMPKFRLRQKLVDRLNLVTRENLSGLRVIRAFITEKLEQKKFEDANTDLTKTNLFVNRAMVLMFPFMMLIMNFTSSAIIWIGSYLINGGTLEIGNMMAFLQYVMQIIMSFLMLSMILIFVPSAAVSAKRVGEVLKAKPSITDPENPKSRDTQKTGEVEFRNVYFSYGDSENPVLENISFTAKPGKTTAIIGSTGSGKTSLVNLIPRFYDVTEGSISVSGVDVRDQSMKELRDQIGYVPQKGALFSGTVKSNITYGREDATEDEMKKAAVISQSMEFISGKENGFESEIAQGGQNVSGGQKQRLSIARALAKKPDIYIFDDSFSALDFQTDAALRKALKKEIKNITIIIIAQRISTIMDADQIIVLDEGKITGIGNHKDLMKTCSVYREIALSQLSEEELS